jgi:hypothetical protein
VQDPRSRVYNFPPTLQSIPDVRDFAFERLTGFVTSSADTDLNELAKREGKPYAGSTSSLTGFLTHAYFLLSADKLVNTVGLSSYFQKEVRSRSLLVFMSDNSVLMFQPKTFTPGQRMPVTLNLNYRDGVYSFDSGGYSAVMADKNVLTWMGTMLENFLTKDSEEFEDYMRTSENSSDVDAEPKKEAYRYSKSTKFVMRSQLDCIDPRLPGTGVFDIKTRAALPIRLDQLNWEENSGYQILHLTGPIESFEKEYYDLIRSAFLKYRCGPFDSAHLCT